MIRVHDWPEKLYELIAQRLHTPFEWGVNDCGNFAADAVLKVTGSDPLKEFRGKWKTELGAAKALKKMGGVEAFTTKLLGGPINHRQALRGDVVLIQMPLLAVGVCVGPKWVAQGPEGLVFGQMSECLKAWRI